MNSEKGVNTRSVKYLCQDYGQGIVLSHVKLVISLGNYEPILQEIK